ncbi:MAG: PH domain-containing protein [Microbacteriaceae bacterium]|jgi:membrane protein YdbS with pleckstrin-like domain|nr:PH domain-containing protein [Microbacteriaceae bacterium]MCI1206984.1 PH domain-containing protein [Microbacteriaceae bacterium]
MSSDAEVPVFIFRPRPHGLWLFVLLCMAAAWALTQYWLLLQSRDLLLPALLTGAALVIVLLVLPWTVWLSRKTVVAEDRVTVSRGVLRSALYEVLLGEVREVRLERSVRDRLLGTGTILLDTDRGTTVKLPGVPYPRLVQQIVNDRVGPARVRLASRAWAPPYADPVQQTGEEPA